MENFRDRFADSEAMMENMLNGAAKIWESISAMDQPSFDIPGMNSGEATKSKEEIFKAWKPAFNTWQAFAEHVNNKEMFENFAGNRKEGYETVQKLFRSGLDGYSFFQNRWLETVQNVGNIFRETNKKDDGNIDIFKLFNEIYQKEISRVFSVPSLGLSREYQQRMNQMMDKANIFNGALMEFTYFLYVPFEKSFKIMQDTLADLAEKKSLPDDTNEYYQMWIEQLEKHYMVLFQSSEYIEALDRVVGAMSDFRAAQQLIIQDCFKMYGIPGEKDMDELYRDIYFLKKRIRKLEKAAENNS